MNVTRKGFLIILISAMAIVLFGFAGLFVLGKSQLNSGSLFNRAATKIFDYNTIEVISNCDKVDQGQSIKIFYGENCIFNNGKTGKGIGNRYGWNCFEVQYEDEIIYSICHFKKNNWHVNDYVFELVCHSDSTAVGLKIQGPDSSEEISYKRIQ